MLTELRKDDDKAKLAGWVVHDLRPTARSLMSRAGVQPRHAEMALGHVVAGVEGVDDRHRYLDEKRWGFLKPNAAIGEHAQVSFQNAGRTLIRSKSAIYIGPLTVVLCPNDLQPA